MVILNEQTYSLNPDLDAGIRNAGGRIPLTWIKSVEREDPATDGVNFGDAASPVIVSAISRMHCVHAHFNSRGCRLVAVGTIGQEQRQGHVHFWGSGVDGKINHVDPSIQRYLRPPDTEFYIHALRGPVSRAAFVAEDIDAPQIYGDPAWFLPRILAPKVEVTHELGVIVHISELTGRKINSSVSPALKRYHGGEGSGVKIISTFHHRSWGGFESKLAEILSCRRIISTSFHGLIIPQAYGIPSIYFPSRYDGGAMILRNLIAEAGNKIDHRVADFYAGAGYDQLPAYAKPMDGQTDWDDIISWIDNVWEPLKVPVDDFFASFPVRKLRTLEDQDWSLDKELESAIIW